MPQKSRYGNIFQTFTVSMSTLQIHIETKTPKTLTLSNSSKSQPRISEKSQSIKTEDLAGLSWILLNRGDEF